MTKANMTNSEQSILSEIIAPLCRWYAQNKRDLPWRRTSDPYKIWISEIMLQQTRVEAVIPYYERFTQTLPTIADLASCDTDRLLKLWEGLGYYSRVRNMQTAAQQICEQHDGTMPNTLAELRNLKGIGTYTAGAIASIAFDLPVPAVDGNVLRIASRLTRCSDDILLQSTKNRWEADLLSVMQNYFSKESPQTNNATLSDHSSSEKALFANKTEYSNSTMTPGAFNQALMDLGAGICVPNGTPLCAECPLAHLCQSHAHNDTADYPVRIKKTKRRKEKRTVLLISDGKKIAVRKRPSRGLLAGLYEFPNIDGHLSSDEALALSSELGFEPLRIKPLDKAKHIFSHIEWHMIGYEILVPFLDLPFDNSLFVDIDTVEQDYALPSAFQAYAKHIPEIKN